MVFLIIVGVVILVIVLYKIDKHNMLKQQVDNHGGMMNKYGTLLNDLLEKPEAKLIKVSRSKVQVISTIHSLRILFTITETFNNVHISLLFNSQTLGKQSKDWKYPPSFSQEKIIHDIQEHIKWFLNITNKENTVSTDILNFDFHNEKSTETEIKKAQNIKSNYNYLEPKDVFELCKEIASILPVNYSNLFDIDINYNEEEAHYNGFNGQYLECRKFTALLFCCSTANAKKIINNNLRPEDFNSPFFSELINLLLAEARKIKSNRMLCELGGGFDGESLYVELTPEYKLMEYLYKASHVIVHSINPKYENIREQYLGQLAYNYFEKPGSIAYSDFKKAINTDEEIIKEMNEIILKITDRWLPSDVEM